MKTITFNFSPTIFHFYIKLKLVVSCFICFEYHKITVTKYDKISIRCQGLREFLKDCKVDLRIQNREAHAISSKKNKRYFLM